MGSPAEMGGSRAGKRSPSSFSATCRRLSQYLKENGGFGELSLGMTRQVEGKQETLRTLNLLPGVEASAVAGDDVPAVSNDPKPAPSPLVDLLSQRPAVGAVAGKVPDLNREQRRAQMTIFYGGKLVVFNNFPADKAKELMDMAGRGCPPPVKTSPVEQPAAAPVAPPPPPQRPTLPPAEHHPAPATTALGSTSETAPVTAGVVTAAAADAAAAATPVVAEAEAPQKPPPAAGSDLPIARRVSLHRFLEKRKDRITAKAPYQVNSSSAAGGSSSAPPPAKGKEDGRQWLGLAPQASKMEEDSTGGWLKAAIPGHGQS